MALKNIEMTVKKFRDFDDLINEILTPPDLVILDYFLPSITGLDILTYLEKFNKNVRVIVHSSNQEENIHSQFAEKGVYKFIVKSPGSIALLVNTAKKAVSFTSKEIR
jgi:response regulator of citrate/malate metabolism